MCSLSTNLRADVRTTIPAPRACCRSSGTAEESCKIRFAFFHFRATVLIAMIKGRPLAATPTQVEQVQALASQGVSKRKIAETVFGDARFRGRVERIGRRQVSSPRRDLLTEGRAVQADEHELPPIRELRKLERMVETEETLERLNALTRKGGGSTSFTVPARPWSPSLAA